MQNSDKKSKKEKRGLYFALAVCLLAVGIAAWGTYNSVSDYVKTREEESSSAVIRRQEDPEKAGAGRGENSDLISEAENSKSTSSVAVEPEAPVNNQGVTSAPEESLEESQPVQNEEEVNAPIYSAKENFKYPVSSREIISKFSGGELVYNETMKDYRAHSGTDITATKGEQVLAANDGVVKKAYTDLLLGNVVIVEHGSYNLWYCGLGEDTMVKEGDVVAALAPIGTIAEVPFEAQSTHLHLQVEKDGVFVDPLDLPFE